MVDNEAPTESVGLTGGISVGRRIKVSRVELGLSQAQLAGDDLSDSYISLIESGQRAPSDDVLEMLANRLRCSTQWLRTGLEEDHLRAFRLRLSEAKIGLHTGDAGRAHDVLAEVEAHPALPAELVREARVIAALAFEVEGQMSQAIDMLSQETEADERAGKAPDVSTLVALSRCLREAGDVGAAIDTARIGLARLERDGLPVDDAYIELAATLMGAYNERADYVMAGRLAEKTLAAADELGSPRARGSAYWNAMIIAVNDGRLGDAERYADRALALYGEIDAVRNLARLKVAYAWLLIRLQPGRPQQALDLLDSVDDDLRSSGSAVDQAYADTERARAHLQLGNLAPAADAAESARSRLRGVDAVSPVEAARADAVLALVKVSSGDQAGGIALVSRAATILHDIGASRSAGEVWRELGDVALQAGDVAAASTAFQRALDAVGVASVAPVPAPGPTLHRTLPTAQTVETAK